MTLVYLVMNFYFAEGASEKTTLATYSEGYGS